MGLGDSTITAFHVPSLWLWPREFLLRGTPLDRCQFGIKPAQSAASQACGRTTEDAGDKIAGIVGVLIACRPTVNSSFVLTRHRES